ncbi:oxidoreductase [Gammaproteobacteria bacterium 42_54_T18]|nr:oxidoreductase [Gammaproteobacteria bacterium 42_54_T18]
MMKIAFIGLGIMGFPMAGHLANARHDVTVFNRTAEKASRWTKNYSGSVAITPKIASKECDIVFVCVGNDDDLRSVVLGDNGVLNGMKANSILIDHTTASADVARELFTACSQQSIGFIDAPVSGGQQGAENGQLTIMCGGENGIFKQAESIMDCYAKQISLMGPAGSGQLTKMVNQICIAGLVQGLAEGLQFAENAGLDAHKVIEVISKGAAQSWQMDNRHETMIKGEYEHGFAVDWMRKDLGICFDEARGNGSQLPVAALVDQFYAGVQADGGGRWDTSSLKGRLK